jgi:hypothetical protein
MCAGVMRLLSSSQLIPSMVGERLSCSRNVRVRLAAVLSHVVVTLALTSTVEAVVLPRRWSVHVETSAMRV